MAYVAGVRLDVLVTKNQGRLEFGSDDDEFSAPKFGQNVRKSIGNDEFSAVSGWILASAGHD